MPLLSHSIYQYFSCNPIIAHCWIIVNNHPIRSQCQILPFPHNLPRGDITDILVLYGGNSTERAVAIKSALGVIEAFSTAHHRVVAYDWQGGTPSESLLRLAGACDAVFLALHGGDGEGGALQAALEKAGIFHYTGTDPRGAALALDKAKAKKLVSRAGVPVARGTVWEPSAPPPEIALPAIVKPNCGGSSVGLKTITCKQDFTALKSHEERLLVEEYLCGREFTVGILGEMVLPVVEIIPNGGVYDYAHKYTVGATKEICPAALDKAQTAYLHDLALRAFSALHLRDFARIDFKENAAGVPCFLEANTLPGLTETSLLPLAASTAGLSYLALCEHMATAAAKRKRQL